MSKQTTATHQGHHGHNFLTHSCRSRWTKHQTKYAYDAANRLTNMVDNVGTTAFSYTQIGELQSEISPWPNDSVNYSYNQQLRTGMALAQPVGSWAQSYGYDAMWRMTNIISGAGTFSYHYAFQPASPLISQVTLPNGGVVTNIYDGLTRLRSTAMLNSSGVALDLESYSYDPNSYRTQQVFTAGNYINYAYDKIGQLIGAHGYESSPVTNRWQEQFGYSYDKADNLLDRTNRDLLENFGYSADNELTNANLSGDMTLSGSASGTVTNMSAKFTAVFYPGTPQQEQFSFGLDPVDLYKDFTFATYVDAHRVFFNGAFTNIPDYYAINSGQSNAATLTYSLIYQSGSNKATNNFSIPTEYLGAYLYDQNGNLTNDMLHTYSYDCENELTNISVPGQWQSSFVYDGLGRRRIEYDYKWNGSGWTPTNVIQTIYDGNVILQERDGHNNVLTTYTRGADFRGGIHTAGGIGGLLARTDPNGSTFYHADGNGNIMALMNTSQNLVAQYLYNPFGQIEGEWGSYAGVNEMQFSSMPTHVLSGLSLYAFRAYNPNLQRWLSRDPIGEAGGIDLYQFVDNSPVNRIDPFGLEGNPISSTFPGLSGAWNSSASGGAGSFYGPGLYQSLAIQQANAQAAAQAAAIDAYNATVSSDFWLDANGQAMAGIDDLSVDYTAAYLGASSGLGLLSACKNAAEGASTPLGFASADQFSQSVQELNAALAKSGITDASIGVRGSSVTGVSFGTGQPFSAASDIDFFVESGQLTQGLRTSQNIPGFVNPNLINSTYDPIAEWSQIWSENLGRNVSVGGFQPGTVPTGPVIRP